MEIILDVFLILVGFALLIVGADKFVDGSCAVAAKLKIPTVVVGLTIVAVGTSLPEMAVSTFASVKGANALALSNVIGSNIFNALMVLGVSALFISIPVKSSMLRREYPLLVIITLIVLRIAGESVIKVLNIKDVSLFGFNQVDKTVGVISRLDGICLLLLFVAFICWTVNFALQERKKAMENEDDSDAAKMSNWKCALYIIVGAIMIMIGGNYVVNSAKSIAFAAGMSEALIGLTIVALGTSLPELVTSAVAAKKGEADIAIGNVVGSNIANILLVLGMSAAISPVKVTLLSFADTVICLVITVIVFIASGTRKNIKRFEGVVFILIYAAYLAYIICRQIYG